MAEPISPSDAESAQPEGPRTPKKAREAKARPRKDYASAADREINDLKEQREKIQMELSAANKRLDEALEKRLTLQAEITSLKERNVALVTAGGISLVISSIASICMVAGSALISSDSNRGAMFWGGWFRVAPGIVVQIAMAIMTYRINR